MKQMLHCDWLPERAIDPTLHSLDYPPCPATVVVNKIFFHVRNPYSGDNGRILVSLFLKHVFGPRLGHNPN